MADLVNLNHMVVSMIKSKRSQEAMIKSMAFKVGDKVIFISNRRGRTVGEIVKMNRSNAIVKVKGAFGNSSIMAAPYTMWNVPFNMLTLDKQ